jgi:hypothetical protein
MAGHVGAKAALVWCTGAPLPFFSDGTGLADQAPDERMFAVPIDTPSRNPEDSYS